MEAIIGEDLFRNYIVDYGRLVFSVCFSMTGDYFEAEDLAQETFLSAYKNLGQFDGNNIKAWLTKIATNKCIDYLKSASSKTIPTSDDFLDTFAGTRASPETLAIENSVKEKLLHICHQLKEPYRTIATEHFYHGISISEISRNTGQNIRTLQTQVYRAKALLRKRWKEEFL